MKSLASVAVVLLLAVALSACANTIRGAGKDVADTVDAAVE